MILPEEIKRKSDEFNIEIDNIQRDYVFGWIIAGIFLASSLRNKIILKGGNALRKAYFPHFRFSADLDFSTPGNISPGDLLQGFNEACRYAEQKAGIQFDYNRNKVDPEPIAEGDKRVYKAKLYFLNLVNQRAECDISVRVDVSEFDRIILPIQERNLIHPYSDASVCQTTVKITKLEEVIADKLKLLLQRRYAYDFYDLIHATVINKEIGINRNEVVSTFLKKTIFEPSPISAMNLLVSMPFEFVKGFWKKVSAPKQGQIELDDAIEKYEPAIRLLFEDFQYGEGRALAFFPAWIRNPILKAGQELTKIRMTYDEHERLVEPYSLVYKRRSDGVAREYFYAFDTSGGRSGQRSIKAFLNNKIVAIKNTDEKFEPRYVVEISKSGEPAEKSYFGRPFHHRLVKKSSLSKRRTSGRSTFPYSYRPKYVIECSLCGKRFTRKNYSLALNSHKDKSGYLCMGRFGLFVETKY